MAEIDSLHNALLLGPLPAHAPSEDIEATDFAFQPYSSPHSLKSPDDHALGNHVLEKTFSSPPAPPLQNYNYNFLASIYDESSASASNTDHENDYTTGEEEEVIEGIVHPYDGLVEVGSLRSSISSLPGSVLPGNEDEEDLEAAATERVPDTPGRPNTVSRNRTIHRHRSGSLGYKIRSPFSGGNHNPNGLAPASPTAIPADLFTSPTAQIYQQYSTGFRNPSSVRAMQMRDESVFDPSDEVEDARLRSLSGHRRRGSRMSVFSHRSGGSTQTSPTKSRKSGGSPLKQSSGSRHRESQAKTEFPLVLLHCTLLPPSLGSFLIQGDMNDEALLKEVLPDTYWRRWKVLKEKMVENAEVRDRGVLIAHPRVEYELLEERLLESLELEKLRVREGHYLGKEETAGEDDDNDDDATINGGHLGPSSKTKCPDCGHKISMDVEMERKWEVKVYAANGLMRAGAWSAAWSEMEKVDVEVGVWMPEEIRRGVEQRLVELGVSPHTAKQDQQEDVNDEAERRRREIYGAPDTAEIRQEKFDELFEEGIHHQHHNSEQTSTPQHYQSEPVRKSLQVLLLNYFKAMMEDKRNMVIMLLSLTVLFYALQKSAGIAVASWPSDKTNLIPTTEGRSVSMDVSTTTVTTTATTTSISVSTTTVLESVTVPTQTSEDGQSHYSVEDEVGPSQTEASTSSQEQEEATPGVGQVVLGMLVGDDDLME